MWDPDQLAELPVIRDRLLALGDPLGEWLAIRARLDLRDGLDALGERERRELRRAARSLRDQLGSRLILAEDPRLGRPQAVRELGLLIDVSLPDASVDRLLELLTRPDAALLLRLRLRGSAEILNACVAALLARATTRTPLRELGLELEPPALASESLAELTSQASGIGASLSQLFSLRVGAHAVALPFSELMLDRAQPWSPARRTSLGRALASPDPDQRRRALERLREHGVDANHLRAVLLGLLDAEPDPRVREAVFGVVARLGVHAHAMLAVAVDIARERDDPQLERWLASVRGQAEA